jgi:hypothetical protein
VSIQGRIKELLGRVERLGGEEVIEEMELFLRGRRHGRHHRAHSLALNFTWCEKSIKGQNMTFTMLATQSVPVIGSPVKADGTPSSATLSAPSYASSDPTVFSVSPDPATPNGAIVTGVAAGTAILSESATAVEPDGVTTEPITGSATIILTGGGGGGGVAAALVFTFGNPQAKR